MLIFKLIITKRDAAGLAQFIRSLNPVWPVFARAKSAKLVRDLLDLLPTTATDVQIALVKELIEWCVQDKRSFLKQNLESRLGGLYLQARLFTDALSMVSGLLKELKRMDDKLALVSVHLLECKIYHALSNLPKAKAALTAARSAANAVYTPPLTQAALDMQSAILHAQDTDFKTAYSYFIEALDAFAAAKDPLGAQTLKYMLLCKIMMGSVDDIDGLVTGKLGQNYSLGRDVEAMKTVGEAYKQRSLKAFQAALHSHPTELGADPIVATHLNSLYDSLLQQNILRIIQPYSRIQVAHVAEQIGLDRTLIEQKLSLMILDKVLEGILDQAEGSLILTEERPSDQVFAIASQAFQKLDTVVDTLHIKATTL